MGPACATALSTAGLDRLIITDLSAEADSLLDEAQLNRKRGETVSHETGGMKRSADPQLLINGQAEFRELDISDNMAVVSAMGEVDVCVNCAVVRQRRVLAFNVNVAGTLFAIRAAAAAGHSRFINTGPSGTVVGPGYRKFSQVNESVPPWCGTQLYYMTKGLGHEITRIYSECFPIHVLTCLFGGVSTPPQPAPERRGLGTGGWATTLRDCGQALRCALEVPLSVLASRHETFFISPPSPDGWLQLGKASKVLGWEPEDKLEGYFARL
jgi:nucleoside-diphosphate-sugar epimerase